MDDESPMNSLRIQLFKDNKINSLEELIYGNFLINLMYVVLCEENIELIVFCFNSLKYFFKDYDLEDVFFDLSDLTCGNCKILLEIYLKDKKTLLTRCNNCYAVKNIKLELGLSNGFLWYDGGTKIYNLPNSHDEQISIVDKNTYFIENRVFRFNKVDQKKYVGFISEKQICYEGQLPIIDFFNIFLNTMNGTNI